PEDLMLGAVLFGHQEMQAAIAVIDDLVREVGKPRWDWQAPAENLELASALKAQFGPRLDAAYQLTNKQERAAAIDAVRGEAIAALVNEASGVTADAVKGAFKKLEKKIVRGRIIRGEPRIDGRDNKTVRPISVQVVVLPKVHGTALFIRGESESQVAATLGSLRDAQI